ncbi:MAG: MATE family efflux transporter, partial [Marivivens sp.]|nr:MATE family efflux transporter [Marivivens sp.]
MNHTRPTLRQDILPLIRLGMPLVGSSIAAFAIHMTDTIMLGWYDVTALAAVTLGSSWWFILYIFGAGFGFA